jgi:hypothetical protein
MTSLLCDSARLLTTKRDFLARSALGLGGLGLAALMRQNGLAEESASQAPSSPLGPKQPHFEPKAKRVIQIFCEGGPSHVDTFDPKPALDKHHGKLADEVIKDYLKAAGDVAAGMGRLSGKLQRSGFKFARHGQSGMEISELFPKLATHADELCVIRSMHTSSSVHELGQLFMNTGDFASTRPSMGSWLLYGLGAENQNLPGLVSLTEGGSAAGGDKQWGNAFLPPWTLGTGIPMREPQVSRMIENIRSGTTSLPEQRRQLDLLKRLHGEFARKHPADAFLEGHINSFETAFRMQVEATDAFDVEREPRSVRDLYGDSPQGRRLLLARRLVERGVRMVQVHHNGWDTHQRNDERHRELALACDQPLSALIEDLKQRDMLKDTLILWGGEFGRTPTSDIRTFGRDHNAGGFTIWMAGGGLKGGTVYGSTDDFGALAQENRVDVHDLHATILHLMGLNHEKLTYRYAGRDFRLTDVHGKVVKEILT